MPLPHLVRLLPQLRPHRFRIAIGLACLLTTTAFSVASPWVLRLAIDDLTLAVTRQKLWAYAGIVLGLVAVEGFFRYRMRMVLIGVSREVEYELRNRVFHHFTLLSAGYYQRSRIGELMSRASNDMAAVRQVLGPGIMYTANTVASFAGAVTLMLAISPLLSALALAPLALVAFLVRHYGRQIHDRFEQVQAQLAELNTLAQESLAGARVVRAYAQEGPEQERFEAANAEYVSRSRRLIQTTGIVHPGIQFLMGLGSVIVLFVGGRMVVSGTITLGAFVAFGAYLAMLQWPTIALGFVVNIFERGEASMMRIDAILDAPVEVVDGPDTLPLTAIRGELELRGLSFAYDGGPLVLRDLRLSVRAGSTLAIVGPTGSGKSTLVSLLPRLWEAPPGTLFVDGVEVRRIPLALLRRAVGFVPQESFLFSESVRENVAFGLDGDDGERSRWAADLAQLAKDVATFPHGFETAVGERGITLSGGQKQRAALARALAMDPRILVLDDALSAVDTETEDAILRGLRQLRGSRTIVIVSHRISTVKDADLIVVLREGRIVESGTHAELLARAGFYADLHRRQLLEEEMSNGEDAA